MASDEQDGPGAGADDAGGSPDAAAGQGGANRRTHLRYDAHALSAQVRRKGLMNTLKRIDVAPLDYSRYGFAFLASAPWDLGSELVVRLSAGGETASGVAGTITYCRPARPDETGSDDKGAFRIGVSFEDADHNEELHRLERIVKRQ